jgi:hypothetical protein
VSQQGRRSIIFRFVEKNYLGQHVFQAEFNFAIKRHVQAQLGSNTSSEAQETEIDAEFGVHLTSNAGLDISVNGDL